ncbi:UNVERIFIED_CONTAM: hypothetical protein PYX00_007473 [Menopon gallinae]|uniref:RING-type E3 ubiquitin transferase n=1 Tax=Menopon gallinae TaxID=328185 RepID=A0AAW2HJ79_9NEOP
MVETKNCAENRDTGYPQVRVCEIVRSSGSCGFNLTKSKWDPYPWVSTVESGSPAEMAGVQAGDCLLEVNGEDILGLRVKEVANRVKARNETVTVMLWNSGVDPTCTPEALCCGPMPTNLQRLSSCMSNILAALECPICLETIPPPAHQCANGHLICINCRVRTERCPVCRMKFFRGRSLLADQVFNSLLVAFDLVDKDESRRAHMLKQRICGNNNRIKNKTPEIKINFLASPTNKLLSRLLGSRKSTSAENLSNSTRSPSNLSVPTEDDFYSSLRAKSLSSNEIFTPDPQMPSRTPSILSSRPGSGLLEPITFSKRPASYHGSSENLNSRIQMDFGTDFSKGEPPITCYCPFEADCEQIMSTDIMHHLRKNHEGPVLHFFKPKIQFDLPLPNSNSTIIVTTLGTLFIIKVLDYEGRKKNHHLWIWNTHDDGRYYAEVTLKEISSQKANRCQILPLSSYSWKKIVSENCGLKINLKNEFSKLDIQILKMN